MDIILNVKKVEIKGTNNKKYPTQVNLIGFDIDEIIEQCGKWELLEIIGKEEADHYFGLED